MYILNFLAGIYNYSRKDISLKTGISLPYINELFTGKKTNPSREIVHKLATLFNISDIALYKLMYYTDEKQLKKYIMHEIIEKAMVLKLG